MTKETCCGLMSLFCADGVQMSVVLALSAEAVRGRQRKNVPGVADAKPGTFCVYLKGRSKNYEFKYSLILLFLFRSLFVSFDVILSSFISHIARYAPSSTYKSTYERRTKINSTYFLERP